jgi:alkylation response protein AidB-like acyl-CoA dehydrogenase
MDGQHVTLGDMSVINSFEDPALDTFRQSVRDWLLGALPDVREIQAEESAAEHIARLRAWEKTVYQGGWAGISWPREYGGRGLGLVEEVVFQQEACHMGAPEELNHIGKHIVGPNIVVNGTDQQRAKYLPGILSGDEIWCEGYSEPGAGSDLAAVRTTAAPDGSRGFRIEGHKIWTSRAHIADRCWLLARTSPEAPRHHNLSMFLLDMHQDGIQIRPIKQITGAAEFCEVFFDGAFVERADLIGEENEGWRLATIPGFRAGIQNVRNALRRYTVIVEWLEILDSCCAKTADDDWDAGPIATKAELLNWQVMRTAEKLARQLDWYPSAAVLSVFWGELLQSAAEAGVLAGCPRHRAFWRQKVLESVAATIYGGTAQIQRNVIASRVLNLPRS